MGPEQYRIDKFWMNKISQELTRKCVEHYYATHILLDC